jgi:prepilin-type N-terminal cleavage/methylation domain-containing protein/prepilin-type processing-associated H-X9-DG protein
MNCSTIPPPLLTVTVPASCASIPVPARDGEGGAKLHRDEASNRLSVAVSVGVKTPSWKRRGTVCGSTAFTAAFTLVELLTVIVIIGILAAIILPVTAKVRQSARRVRCVSNLRQMGIGVASFVLDSKGRLPGALYTTTTCMYKGSGDNGHLGSYIYHYMGMPRIASGVTRRGEVFACPGWFQNSGQSGDLRFFGLRSSYTQDGQTKYAFGDANGGVDANGNSKKPPGLLEQIPTPSRMRAVWDIDGGLNSFMTEGFPEKPIHGIYRNVLFFDWHVKSLNVGNGTKEEWTKLWADWGQES